MTLLREIQAACTDPSVDTSNLLRKCKVLAARLGHEELGAWARRELEGYPEEKSVPEYRRLKVQSVGHFDRGFGSHMRNAPIPAMALPEEIRHFATDHAFAEPIATLEANARAEGGMIEGHWPPDVVAFLQRYNFIYEGATLLQAKQLIPASRIAAIVDTVRTKILDFALAIEAKEPNAGDVLPGEAPQIAREFLSVVYNTTINNGAANIGTQGNASITTGKIEFSSAIAKRDRRKLEELLRKLREATAKVESPDREEAEQALTKVEEQLAAPEPKLPKIKSYLELYATLVTVASPTVKALQEILPHVINVLG